MGVFTQFARGRTTPSLPVVGDPSSQPSAPPVPKLQQTPTHVVTGGREVPMILSSSVIRSLWGWCPGRLAPSSAHHSLCHPTPEPAVSGQGSGRSEEMSPNSFQQRAVLMACPQSLRKVGSPCASTPAPRSVGTLRRGVLGPGFLSFVYVYGGGRCAGTAADRVSEHFHPKAKCETKAERSYQMLNRVL